jgi:hypothetical protein
VFILRLILHSHISPDPHHKYLTTQRRHVAWKLVYKPKKKGGLGVIKLHLQNDALLLKNLDNFISRANLPWVNLIWSQYYSNGRVPGTIKRGSFWWISILRLLTNFKGIAKAHFDTGETILFWQDLWNDHVMKASFPHLHPFAKKVISLLSVLSCNWNSFMSISICLCVR